MPFLNEWALGLVLAASIGLCRDLADSTTCVGDISCRRSSLTIGDSDEEVGSLLQVPVRRHSNDHAKVADDILPKDVDYPGSSQMFQGKYQALIPKPAKHESGGSFCEIGLIDMWKLKLAAKAKGAETWKIVEAQFVSRLPRRILKWHKSSFKAEFVHKLAPWRGFASWKPTRLRNESYGLFLSKEKLIIDARTSWALANAMSTLYQLMEVKDSGVGVPNCPHKIEDASAFPHRGLLLDTSRTYYSVKWIKQLLVSLGEFKINVLHLHLTDTSSWPLEVSEFPELTEVLAYKDINGKQKTYSRKDVRDLVEFARLRGISLLPEIDGPAHAPALATGAPLNLAATGTPEYSTQSFGVEPPPGTWNISFPHALDVVRKVLEQVQDDFSTAPYIHLGGDEPSAGALCDVLTNETMKQLCFAQCTSFGNNSGSPYSPGCGVVPVAPPESDDTYWFPEVLNSLVQKYFDSVDPVARVPRGAWSGIATDMHVHLPPTRLPWKSVLQLWEFPQPGSDRPPITKEMCERYDLIQSSATRPQGSSTNTNDVGWLYLECGTGPNWISMGQNYWCSYASWASIYALNLTQHSGPDIHTKECQDAFIGSEMAIWGEIAGESNAMPLIFPRIVAFAERTWSNPVALDWTQMQNGTGGYYGAPPAWYWHEHLEYAQARMLNVVANFNMIGLGIGKMQPEFCRFHPAFCTNYTNDILDNR